MCVRVCALCARVLCVHVCSVCLCACVFCVHVCLCVYVCACVFCVCVVYQILVRVAGGLSVRGRHLPQYPTILELLGTEKTFAVKVEDMLSSIGLPEYSQAIVEVGGERRGCGGDWIGSRSSTLPLSS